MTQRVAVKIGKIGQKIDQEEVDSHLINFRDSNLLDAFSKVAILILLAGYKQTDYIFVDDKFGNSIDLKKLSRFLSYVLNHRDLAPRKFNLR